MFLKISDQKVQTHGVPKRLKPTILIPDSLSQQNSEKNIEIKKLNLLFLII